MGGEKPRKRAAPSLKRSCVAKEITGVACVRPQAWTEAKKQIHDRDYPRATGTAPSSRDGESKKGQAARETMSSSNGELEVDADVSS